MWSSSPRGPGAQATQFLDDYYNGHQSTANQQQRWEICSEFCLRYGIEVAIRKGGISRNYFSLSVGSCLFSFNMVFSLKLWLWAQNDLHSAGWEAQLVAEPRCQHNMQNMQHILNQYCPHNTAAWEAQLLVEPPCPCLVDQSRCKTSRTTSTTPPIEDWASPADSPMQTT